MKRNLKAISCLCMLLQLALVSLTAQQTQSDNGDGTYTNPLIYADFPDPDVIRVDSVYYMVSTTMFIFPGVTILKSYDLVNWEYCANAVQRFDFSPCYDLDGCNRYAHGQWATSLKYHNGKFYCLFITLDEGGFICSATNPEGPWEITHLPRGFYDPGLFFDDDDKIYVAHGYGTINVTELDTNFVAIGNDSLVFTGDIRAGLEGTHVYKIGGFYYLYCTYGGGDGFQVALRSTNIYGPYEERIVIQDNGNLGTGIHQGALVETQTSEWWSVIFQDGGAFGRFPTLQPVTWEDDWPMLGVDGKGVITYPKPDVGREYPITVLPTSDEFDSTALGMQWGWNHNPDSTKWSLTRKPCSLRLSTAKVVSNIREARNTLTQRIFAYYSTSFASTAVVKMTIDSMQDGDVAGIGVFQDPYAYIGVKKIGSQPYVIMVNNGNVVDSMAIDADTVYLRASALYGTSITSFTYSLDNQSFFGLGNELSMQFNLSIFTGNKFCLFNYATIAIGGFVDFDWFRTGMCSKTTVTLRLQVNDGEIQDTNRIKVNPGDSVILVPEAADEGTWGWSGCDLAGSSATQVVRPEANCVVYVKFINNCGYKSNLAYYINVNNITGLFDNQAGSRMVITPNPASSELRIISEFSFNKLSIYSMDGKLMTQEENESQLYSQIVPLHIEPGVYILVVQSTGKSETGRFVVE